MTVAVTAEQAADPSFADWLALGGADKRKGMRTRTTLLIAAADLLAENPPDSLTVATVCAQARRAHGTFYLYFKDRNDLVGVLLGLFADYLQIRMRAAARQGGDPVRNTTAAYFRLFRQHAGLMKCLVVGVDTLPEARAAFQRLNAAWAQTVVRAMLRTRPDRSEAEAELLRRAHALGGMVDQYLTALFVMQDPWLGAVSQDPEAVIDTLTFLWTKGMTA